MAAAAAATAGGGDVVGAGDGRGQVNCTEKIVFLRRCWWRSSHTGYMCAYVRRARVRDVGKLSCDTSCDTKRVRDVHNLALLFTSVRSLCTRDACARWGDARSFTPHHKCTHTHTFTQTEKKRTMCARVRASCVRAVKTMRC